MLYMPTDAMKPKRLQGCFVADREIERLVYFWGSLRPAGSPRFREDLMRLLSSAEAPAFGTDTLLASARQLAREHGRVSTSFLQRRLNVGYPRAARLMDMLEAEGLAGQGEPGKPRPVVLQDSAGVQSSPTEAQSYAAAETEPSSEAGIDGEDQERQA